MGDDIQSKVLAFAFGLSAEIERNLISQRTKEALERKRKEGIVLGRPKGSSKPHQFKLFGQDNKIIKLLRTGLSLNKVARKLKVHRSTLSKYIKVKDLKLAV